MRSSASCRATSDPNLLVGLNTSDDAAVYRLTPDLAIAQTVDFLTPLVDDPYQYGQIAAANAISDIYAMGATPLLALNIVAFPTEALPMTVLGEILRGGADKAREADVRIIGGHSIDDKEPKYGMAVTGLVHPDRILRNSTARPGDRLFLTKPLGMGIISTAIKRDLAERGAHRARGGGDDHAEQGRGARRAGRRRRRVAPTSPASACSGICMR